MPEFQPDLLFVRGMLLAIAIGILSLSGCERSEKVQAYTVPKHEAIQSKEYLADYALKHPKPVPKRMVGVIIPRKTSFWFFKLDGDVSAVASRESVVREFLKTVHFPNPSNPDEIEWSAPEKWVRLPPTQMRYATLVLDGQPRLDISVTTLPIQPDQPLEEQVLANINRWRDQLSLDPIKLADLGQEAESLTIADSSAYWVNLVGWGVPNAGMMPAPHPPVGRSDDQQKKAVSAEEKEDRSPESSLKYDKPAEWEEAPATTFSKVSLRVRDGDNKLDITVTPSRGKMVDNVNRWRGQLEMEPLTEDNLMPTAKKVAVGNHSGSLFEMTNKGRSIYGAIVELPETTWFVKLIGDSALAEREQARFETFLKSLQLN